MDKTVLIAAPSSWIGKGRFTRTALLTFTALNGAPASAQALSCAEAGQESPLELHKHSIMEGWEQREGDPEFVFADHMARYYEAPNGKKQ